MPDMEDSTEEGVECCAVCDEAIDDCECITCEGCGERVLEYCDDCSQCEICNRWNDDCECSTCDHCSERFSAENEGCTRHGHNYCQTCIDRGRVDHYNCAHCGDCFDSDAPSCGNCGSADCCARFSCGDCGCCENCCTCTSEHIRNYGCRDYPAAIPAQAPRDFLYLGVECETEAIDDETLKDAAESIHDKHNHEILMKEDGSLDNGVELVTGKYSLEAHKNLWPRLCETAVKAGLRSWKHSTTGLHVHLSRRFFTQLEIGKFVVFLNSDAEDIRANRRKLAGRDSCHYAKVQKKTIMEGINDNESRYEAVNLTNEKTIEVRIFKGTLNAKHILADIEFCHAVAYWVKQCSIQEAESWQSFWTYVKKHKKEYKDLISFFEPQVSTSETVAQEEVAA